MGVETLGRSINFCPDPDKGASLSSPPFRIGEIESHMIQIPCCTGFSRQVSQEAWVGHRTTSHASERALTDRLSRRGNPGPAGLADKVNYRLYLLHSKSSHLLLARFRNVHIPCSACTPLFPDGPFHLSQYKGSHLELITHNPMYIESRRLHSGAYKR